ncbi:hypothetical protein Mgra_00009589 [Meloidogyne graminicola]|uniref:Uncharacterized protein n=1 Tax=Meloidogyne graminicola TaxID=189291 RepID=A0A8S9Z7H1_9BILA|nr:hypothetical protein Mgra_00009589 [Meloidogyne graminicola]
MSSKIYLSIFILEMLQDLSIINQVTIKNFSGITFEYFESLKSYNINKLFYGNITIRGANVEEWGSHLGDLWNPRKMLALFIPINLLILKIMINKKRYPETAKIQKDMNSLFLKLDALSNFQFRPQTIKTNDARNVMRSINLDI